MKRITRTIRSVDNCMAFAEQMWDDADRRFVTDALAARVDPEQIDAALEASRARRAVDIRRRGVSSNAGSADCRAGRA